MQHEGRDIYEVQEERARRITAEAEPSMSEERARIEAAIDASRRQELQAVTRLHKERGRCPNHECRVPRPLAGRSEATRRPHEAPPVRQREALGCGAAVAELDATHEGDANTGRCRSPPGRAAKKPGAVQHR